MNLMDEKKFPKLAAQMEQQLIDWIGEENFENANNPHNPTEDGWEKSNGLTGSYKEETYYDPETDTEERVRIYDMATHNEKGEYCGHILLLQLYSSKKMFITCNQ